MLSNYYEHLPKFFGKGKGRPKGYIESSRSGLSIPSTRFPCPRSHFQAIHLKVVKPIIESSKHRASRRLRCI